MKKALCILVLILALPLSSFAQEVNCLQLFFGLSKPEGGGVSLVQWRNFERKTLAKTLEGFTVTDAVGYYKGKAERSKVVTIVAHENDMDKIETVAQKYARRFGQESVMLIKLPIGAWEFIGPN